MEEPADRKAGTPVSGEGETSGGEQVVQIIMHDDGQAIMPEGQFIQLNMNDGMQYIQVISINKSINQSNFYSANIPGEARLSGTTAEFQSVLDRYVQELTAFWSVSKHFQGQSLTTVEL